MLKMSNILERDGLTLKLLESLSYESKLGINLKKNLHYFDKERLFEELIAINAWYDEFVELHELALDYRIKSVQSAMLKYDRQINNWLHKYVYKKTYDNSVGFALRKMYENAKIFTEQDFKEAMEHVLLGSEEN